MALIKAVVYRSKKGLTLLQRRAEGGEPLKILSAILSL